MPNLNWNIQVDVDCGVDDGSDEYSETVSIIDDLVYEGLKSIREGLSALGLDANGLTKMIDPNGNEVN